MAQTAETYYSDSANYGSYQFTPLNDFIDEMLLQAQSDPDSYIKTKNRELFILYAKKGIKELTSDMANDVLALELEIGDDLQFIFPQDYVDWVRICVVGDDKNLYELDRNTKSNRAITYLQDHNYNILFGSNGDVLEADGNNVYNFPIERKVYSSFTPQFQKDTSKLSKYGEFSVDKRRGVFTFDSSMSGKSIVIEYVSDGLQWEDISEGDITVHKYFEEALDSYIYHRLVQRDRNVPFNEKERAKREFWGNRQRAFNKLANIKLPEISRAFRANLKWVKT